MPVFVLRWQRSLLVPVTDFKEHEFGTDCPDKEICRSELPTCPRFQSIFVSVGWMKSKAFWSTSDEDSFKTA